MECSMKERWQDYLTTFVGVWVLFSLEVIHYFFPAVAFTSAIAWSHGLVGFALIVVGAAAVAGYQLWEEWVDVLLGLWLIASPWIIDFAGVAPLRWNAVLSGTVVVVLASWVLITGRGRKTVRNAKLG
jgi:SPW repeat